METNVKVLTVCRALRRGLVGTRIVPRINIEGDWLERSGFSEGNKIAVSVEAERLVITREDKYENEKSHRAILNVNREHLHEGDIIVQYKDCRGLWQREIIKTIKEGSLYKISNIPYRAPGLALHDIVETEEEYGLLFFIRVVEIGGNRMVQLDLIERYARDELYATLKLTGCTWLCKTKGYYAINIPLAAPFEPLIKFFNAGVRHRLWTYQQTRF